MTAINPRKFYQPEKPGPLNPPYLHIFGAGLAVDQVPTHAIWREMQAAGSGRPKAPTPAGSLEMRIYDAMLFRAATLRGALRHWPAGLDLQQDFVESYPIPTLASLPPCSSPADEGKRQLAEYVRLLKRNLDVDARLQFHDIRLLATGSDGANPPLAWDAIFSRFEKAGDLNSLLLWGEDGYAVRSQFGGWENAEGESLQQILSRGRRPEDRAESFVAVLLARPAAAEWLRELTPYVRNAGTVTTFADGRQGRTAHRYAGTVPRYDRYLGVEADGTRSWAPTVTPYFPEPWTREQMAQYDGMPTLAKLHRPQVARITDDGRPPTEAGRTEALRTALQAAVDGPLLGQVPPRIFYDTLPGAAGSAQQLRLMRALQTVAPGLPLLDPARAVSMTTRLGDTGAAAAFAGVALASHSAWENGEPSLVVHLRADDMPTVLAVEPMDAAYRKTFRRRPYEVSR